MAGFGEVAVRPLVLLLQDSSKDSAARWAASAALQQIGAPAAKPLSDSLGELEKSQADPSGFPLVITALVATGGTEAIEPLLSVLDKENRATVQKTAVDALGSIARASGDARAVGGLASVLRRGRERATTDAATRALGSIGGSVEDLLLGMLSDNTNDSFRYVSRTLGAIRSSRAVEPLLAALGAEGSEIRDLAIEALGHIGDSRAVEPLIAALGNEDDETRAAAASALGNTVDSQAVDPLLAALWDEDGHVRRGYLRVCGALGKIGDPRAVEPLVAAFVEGLRIEDGEYVKRGIVVALGNTGDLRAVEALARELEHEDLVGRSLHGDVVEALARIGGSRAVEVLLAALEKAYQRERDLKRIIIAWIPCLILALGKWNHREGSRPVVSSRTTTIKLILT